MKFLFDLFPVLLFFVAYKWAASDTTAALELLQALGLSVSGDRLAPILLATAVAIVATGAQVLWLRLRRRRVDTMLWISLALIIVMGGLTLWLQDPAFIMWKPTLLYWTFAAVLGGSAWLLGINLIERLMGAQLTLPKPVWTRLNVSWVVFFAGMGALNIWVAQHFEETTWVSFKLYGGLGLTLAFALLQGIYMSRHLPPDSGHKET